MILRCAPCAPVRSACGNEAARCPVPARFTGLAGNDVPAGWTTGWPPSRCAIRLCRGGGACAACEAGATRRIYYAIPVDGMHMFLVPVCVEGSASGNGYRSHHLVQRGAPCLGWCGRCASACAAEMKPTSYPLGAAYTPRSAAPHAARVALHASPGSIALALRMCSPREEAPEDGAEAIDVVVVALRFRMCIDAIAYNAAVFRSSSL